MSIAVYIERFLKENPALTAVLWGCERLINHSMKPELSLQICSVR